MSVIKEVKELEERIDQLLEYMKNIKSDVNTLKWKSIHGEHWNSDFDYNNGKVKEVN